MSNETTARVHISENFPVSKEALYKAWTTEEALKQWWKPMDKQLASVENNIEEGGRVVYHFEDNLEIHGEYKAVEEGTKLVYSWKWEMPEASLHRGEYLLTVAFNENGNESTLDITQENFADEQAIKPHEAGWEKSLEDLRQYLSAQQA